MADGFDHGNLHIPLRYQSPENHPHCIIQQLLKLRDAKPRCLQMRPPIEQQLIQPFGLQHPNFLPDVFNPIDIGSQGHNAFIAMFYDRVKGLVQHHARHRLQQIMLHPVSQALLSVLEFAVARDDDDLNMSIQLMQLLAQLQPAHSGHANIGQQHIRLALLDHRERMLAVHGGIDGVKLQAIGFRHLDQPSSDDRFVVSNQQPHYFQPPVCRRIRDEAIMKWNKKVSASGCLERQTGGYLELSLFTHFI
ncbi:Uncharacterised protein [Actinobacillus pleuropneumoniae]|nr:Uncharacterised protein [Actinobacillus pleuropneumoniae]